MITFTEEQLGVISNALRVAAERFQFDATEIVATDQRLAQQFERQAKAATEIYALIADREGIQT